MRVQAVVGDMAAVVGVLLDDADQPSDALLVVVVALAFDNDLQQNKLDALKKAERGNYAPSCHGR